MYNKYFKEHNCLFEQEKKCPENLKPQEKTSQSLHTVYDNGEGYM